MSNEQNTLLLEEAAMQIDYFQSHPAKLDVQLEEAIDNQDFDKLYELVRTGRLEIHRLEYQPDPLPFEPTNATPINVNDCPF